MRAASLLLPLLLCSAAAWAGERPDRPKRLDGHLTLYGAGGWPRDRELVVGGDSIPDTRLTAGCAAGIKAGVFPRLTRFAVGVELEAFAFRGRLSSPLNTAGGGRRYVRSELTSLHYMTNVVGRYPGRTFQPHAGAGFGGAIGILSSAEILRDGDRATGTTGTGAPGFQAFTGMRTKLTEHLRLFCEYKFVMVRYVWNDHGFGPRAVLELRSHMAAAGLSYAFSL